MVSVHSSSTSLPPTLFDLYLRYKQGTRAIVAWLASQGGRDAATPQPYTIKDLQAFARVVCARAEPLPEHIAFYFRESIQARKRLSNYFRKASGLVGRNADADTDTVNHEYFTASLNEIYYDLCKCCSDSLHQVNANNGHSRNECPRKRSPGSSFNLLDVSDSSGNDDEDETTALEDDSPAKVLREEGEQSSGIVGDSLHDWLELVRFSEELQVASEVLRTSWMKAGRQEIPLALAASTTNTIFISLKSRECQIQLLLDSFRGGERTTPDTCCGTNPEFVSNIHEIFCLLEEIKSSTPDPTTQLKPSKQGCTEYLSKNGKPTRAQKKKAVGSLCDNVAELSSCEEPSYIVQDGTPLVGEICLYGRSNGAESRSLGLSSSIGIQFLLRGFQAFIWPDGESPKIATIPRLQALKFAQEVRDSIEPVLADKTMPCRCCMTLASNLENFQKDLDDFFRERYFDHFVWSPWISGSHMLEILETAFNYSMRLCSYRYYFGSVMHLYNCLKFSGQLPCIPFLEVLCTVFHDIVFPGGRPKAGFRSNYRRLKGGRLKQSSVDRTQWHLAISKQGACEAAGFGTPGEPIDSNFRYEKTSLLHAIKKKGHQIDKATWQKVDAIRKSTFDPGPDTDKIHSRSPTRSCSSCEQSQLHIAGGESLLDLEDTIAQTELVPSLKNPLPIGRINYFKLYLASVRVMASVSNEYHDDQPASGYCICFVEELLKRADFIANQELTSRREPFGYKTMVTTFSEALSREFALEKADWKQYLWEHL